MRENEIARIHLLGPKDPEKKRLLTDDAMISALRRRHPVGEEWLQEALEAVFAIPKGKCLKIINKWVQDGIVVQREENGVFYFQFSPEKTETLVEEVGVKRGGFKYTTEFFSLLMPRIGKVSNPDSFTIRDIRDIFNITTSVATIYLSYLVRYRFIEENTTTGQRRPKIYKILKVK